MKLTKLSKILPILICPICRSNLVRNIDSLKCYTSGHVFPFVDDKPILVREFSSIHITKPDSSKISANIAEFNLDQSIRELEGFKLHLGSGNVPCNDDNVISADILPNANVDVVCEAEFLPFRDDSFVYIESGAVFEHLFSPLDAIAEVKRILKPNGSFYIDTAFMQSYHGFPSHYFNMTAQAIETFLVGDFCLEYAGVPISGSPAIALQNLLIRFLENIPQTDRNKLFAMNVSDFNQFLLDRDNQIHLYSSMTEHSRRAMAASIVVKGKKPINYQDSSSGNTKAIKDYYTSRTSLIERHHQMEFYKRRVCELGIQHIPDHAWVEIDSVESLLDSCKAADELLAMNWQLSKAKLDSLESKITVARDFWIRVYLQNRNPSESE